MSHRESEEKIWKSVFSQSISQMSNSCWFGVLRLTASRIRPLNPRSSRTTRRVSMSTRRTTRSSHVTQSRPLSRFRLSAVTDESSWTSCTSVVLWKSKNCPGQRGTEQQREQLHTVTKRYCAIRT
jgi:hypothetical protein